jgi:gliding motility-associated protein GldL
MSSNSIFDTKQFKKIMAYIYGWGASVVIVGALFKIMHWPGADLMLILGLGTEAVIFFFSVFEPIHAEYDWSLVYPELAGIEPTDKKAKNQGTISQQLDKMLADAKVGPELIGSLGTGLKSLSENVKEMSSISGATVATNEYTANISKASKAIESIGTSSNEISNSMSSFSGGLTSMVNNLTSSANESASLNTNLSKASKAIESIGNSSAEVSSSMSNFAGGLSTMASNLSATVNDSAEFKVNLDKLNKNLGSLNSVYGNMLSAMGGAKN